MLKTLVAFALVSGTVGPSEVTDANWDEVTAGKAVFVKFQAPW